MQTKTIRNLRTQLLGGATLTALVLSESAFAQAAADEIVVTGTRQVIQDSINLKRQSVQIVDGLSADEIGDLPALSIGEALESITGAASHRENGGATEISIRGLGPFLSLTTFNGREATNGSGDRSVNFSQFPSELLNKIAIYKTQDASLIEGGVAGLISLETVKPLEYGKRRLQFDIKGNVNPDQLNIDDSMAGDIGFRGTLSYIDQFELGGLGDIGISVGGQISHISQPEAEMRSSSPANGFACIIDPTNTDRGYGNPGNTDCEDSSSNDINGLGLITTSTNADNLGYATQIDPATGNAIDAGQPYAFAGSSRGFRQNDTLDERDSLFAAVQWQPNDRLDVNLDVEWSKRVQSEDRHDLQITQAKDKSAADASVGTLGTIASLVVSENGTVSNWEAKSDFEHNNEIFSRDEEYIGGGLSAEYEINDKLTGSVDVSFSETTRVEEQIILSIRDDVSQPWVRWSRDSNDIVTFDLVNVDVTDAATFGRDFRMRIDSDLDRVNRSEAARLDFNYEADYKNISSVDFGVRASELTYLALAGGGSLSNDSRVETSRISGNAALDACSISAEDFPESDFFSNANAGPLFSNVTALGDVNGVAPTVTSTSNTWASYDNECVVNALLTEINADSSLVRNGSTNFSGTTLDNLVYPTLSEENSGTIDVAEKTLAAYVKANYEAEVGSMPVRGNVGVRIVNTEVDSVGYRQGFNIATAADGSLSLVVDPNVDLEKVNSTYDYTEVLPSFTFVADVNDDVVVRGGAFRGLSRVDPADMGFSRTFSTNTSNDIFDPDDLITSVNANGNPAFDPLTSWNFDLSTEWYPNADSILSVGAYYKRFKGGFETVTQQESYSIDGTVISLGVDKQQTNEDESSLFGVEMTGSHRFSYLPGYLSGLGVKASYNYADSNFRFEDDAYGDGFIKNADGTITQTDIGIVAPANIPGFSNHSFSGQAYYQIGGFDGSLIYKYRSEYFQPYTSNGGDDLRYVGDVGVWEARASYRINDNYRVKVEAINIFDEPKKQYFFVNNNLGEANYYGPRIFFGLQGKF